MRPMKSRAITACRALFCLGFGGIAGTFAPAEAQQATPAQGSAQSSSQAATDGDTLQEVVVTAQFRKQNLQDTPIAITAVNGALLESRSDSELKDLTQQAPNVDLRQTTPSFGPSLGVTIRGIGQNDFDPALEPGVGIYIDDVYYGLLTGANFDLLDLDRVEILRGPQGTLAGRNSEGGAIKLFSQKPQDNESGSAAVSYGAYDLVDGRATGNFSVIPNTLMVRFSLVSRREDGYVDRVDYGCSHPGAGLTIESPLGSSHCSLGTEGGTDYHGGRLAVRWLANDAVEVNLTGDIIDGTSDVAPTTLVAIDHATAPAGVGQYIPANPYTTYASFTGHPVAGGPSYQFDPQQHTLNWGTAGTVDVQLSNNLTLKSITAFRGVSSNWAEDNDASPLPIALGADALQHHQFSQELRLSGTRLANVLDYTLGLYYFDETTVHETHQIFDYTPGGTDFVGDDPVVASSYAAFGDATWHITDRLNFNGGLRYTEEKKAYYYSRENPDGTPNALLGALNSVVGRYEGNKVDYRADFDYRWNDDLMTYASVSTGFKGGGITPRPFTVAEARSFAEEDLTDYEVGAKSDLFDRHLRLNGAVFFNQLRNIQGGLVTCPQFSGPFPCTVQANVGDAHLKGAELEVEAHPLPHLSIDASVSYIDFEFTRTNPQAGIPPDALDAGVIPQKYSAGIQYEVLLGSLGSLTPRADWSRQSGFYTQYTPGIGDYINGYNLVNLRLSWKSPQDDWEVAGAVTNLASQLYYLSYFNSTTNPGFGTLAGTPAPPREWSLTLKYNFGGAAHP